MSVAARVIREFCVTYADATHPDMTESQWNEAARKRRLTWQSPRRLSLADAVQCYDRIRSYNEFHPGLLHAFSHVFGNAPIQVTPAREYSVAVYFHVPAIADLRNRVEQFARDHFYADDIGWTDPGTLRCWWD
jgi:hypothetical protein